MWQNQVSIISTEGSSSNKIKCENNLGYLIRLCLKKEKKKVQKQINLYERLKSKPRNLALKVSNKVKEAHLNIKHLLICLV